VYAHLAGQWIRVIGFLWVLSFFLSVDSPVLGQDSLTLTLADALFRAAEHNEAFLITEEEQVRADAQVAQARAEVLPKLNFYSNYTRNFEIPEQFVEFGGETQRFKFGYEHSALWGFSASQSLFKGGQLFAAWAAARLYGKYVKTMRRAATLDLQQDVATAFYDAVLAAQYVEVARQTLQLATETRNVVKQKFDEGQASEYDLLRSNVQVANLLPEVTQAENGRELSLTNLRNLLGIDAGVPLSLRFSYPDSAAWETESLEDLISRARANSPGPRQAELEVRLREKAVTVARAEHFPSLELSGDYSVNAYREQFGYDHWQRTSAWRATLSLSIPIFEGLRISSGVKQAKVDLAQARLKERSINKLVALGVEKSRNDFVEAKQRLASQSETVFQAEEGYQIAQLRYQEGVGTQLEVTDALVALTTARLNQKEALRDYLVARVNLRRAVGEPVLKNIDGD